MKIVKLENIQKVIINIDGDTPINIQLVDNINETPVYWRVGDDKKSLLEFAILPNDGGIATIILVAIDTDFVQYVANDFIASNKNKFGFPIVDVN
ncbi:hypothetical protein EAE91_07015 [Photorhabdus noenieputensis]|uniref:hypothetical protein n=1 Tax=Photorhabdus noenieputensis TaxID=1208607 RepID=UPI001BD44815|nr:hypothetical protein [Photorhabdus noenieputensis]MBS9436932.1 hypothetical protein [Photorhabdus noenieputensis]MCK3667199.1 hypothetical protein [Photorhabdus noenieputensis]